MRKKHSLIKITKDNLGWIDSDLNRSILQITIVKKKGVPIQPRDFRFLILSNPQLPIYKVQYSVSPYIYVLIGYLYLAS